MANITSPAIQINEGNVGIGTSYPEVKLHIQGTVNVDDTKLYLTENENTLGVFLKYNGDSNKGELGGLSGSENPIISWARDGSDISFITSGSEALRVNSSGNIGVGTSSPTAKLHVSGGGILGSNSTNPIAFTGSSSINAGIGSYNDNTDFNLYSAGVGNVKVRTGAVWNSLGQLTNVGIERMRVNADGNVGIGATDIFNKFNIVGDNARTVDAEDRITFIYSNDSDNFRVGIVNGVKGGATGADRYGFIDTTSYEVSTGIYSSGMELFIQSSGGVSRFGGESFFNDNIVVLKKTFLGDQINMQEDHFINRRFEMDAIDNDTTNYILLCMYAGGNDVNGSITMDRTSGLRHACKVDILISAGSSALPVGTVSSVGISGNASLTSYSLVKCTYNSTEHIALRIINPDGYYESSGAYFNGRIKSTGEELLPVPGASLSSISDFKVNESHQINGDDIWNAGNSNLPTVNWAVKDLIASGDIGVGTTSPEKQLEILYPSYIDKDTVEGVIRLVGQSEAENSGDALSAGIGIEFYNKWQGGSPYSIGRISARSSQSYDGGLQFDVSQNTGVGQTNFITAMTILDTGKVGIGVTSPSYAVDVLGTSAAVLGVRSSGFAGIDVISDRDSGNLGGVRFRHSGDTAQSVEILGLIGGSVDFKLGGSGEIGPSSKVRFDSDGNVGVGVTAPVTKLHISNSTKIDDALGLVLVENTATGGSSNTNSSVNVKNDSGTSQFMQWEGNGLRIGSRIVTNTGAGHVIFTSGADSEKMRILANGNIGVGTTNPGAKLEVYGDSVNILINNTAETDSGIIFGDVQATTSQRAAIKFNSGDEKLKFFVNDETAERMVIDTVGHLGVGTATPAAPLELFKPGASPNSHSDVMGLIRNITYTSTDASGENKLMFGWSNHYGANIAAYKSSVNRTGFKIYTEVGFNNQTLSTTFNSFGNVGIGTDLPGSRLAISGTGTGCAMDFMNTTATTGRTYRWVSLNVGGFSLEDITGGNVSRITVVPNGNIGIGTTNPVYKLDVIGNLSLESGVGPVGLQGPVIDMFDSTYANKAWRLNADGEIGKFELRSMSDGGSQGTVDTRISVSHSDGFTQVNGVVKTLGYQSIDGSDGLTGSFSFVDHDSETRTLTIKNGLITAKS